MICFILEFLSYFWSLRLHELSIRDDHSSCLSSLNLALLDLIEDLGELLLVLVFLGLLLLLLLCLVNFSLLVDIFSEFIESFL